MRMTLSSKEILLRVKQMSHDELEAMFPDPEARYHLEASEEKEDTIKECMNVAFASVIDRFSRFLDTNDILEDPEYNYNKNGVQVPEYYEVLFASSERRMQGKENAFKETMYALIAAKTLGGFYLRNGHTELGSKWNSLALSHEEAFMRLIYRKRPPKLHTYYAPGYYSTSNAENGGKSDPEIDDGVALYVSR